MGMGMMSLRLIEAEIKSGKLIALKGRKKHYQNEMSLVVPAHAQKRPLFAAFAKFLESEL
jgi:hypothetical protein